MGQRLSCKMTNSEDEFFNAVQIGDLECVESLLRRNPSLIHQLTVYDKLSSLHIAAANGHIQVLSMMLGKSVSPDILNRHKQNPLMIEMHGKIECAKMLIQEGANILMFDSLNGRTCLHYAAYYGHYECLQAILSAAHSTPVVDYWWRCSLQIKRPPTLDFDGAWLFNYGVGIHLVQSKEEERLPTNIRCLGPKVHFTLLALFFVFVF